MEAIPKDVIECAILDGQIPQCGDGAAWCEEHGNCYRCAKDIHDMMVEEIRRLKAERDRALAELDKALGERDESDGWVRLPVDADGKYIRIGDVMEWCDSGETLTVVGIGSDALFYIDGGNAEWTAARNKRHHVPTVEDVLRQFLGECESAANLGYDEVPQEVFDDYAAKLRLAGDA